MTAQDQAEPAFTEEQLREADRELHRRKIEDPLRQGEADRAMREELQRQALQGGI